MKETLKKLVTSNIIGVEFTTRVPSCETVNAVEAALNCRLGKQMKEYLLSFGSLWKDSIELYGVNEIQKLDSDLVKTTLNVAEYYDKMHGMVVIDNLGDGQYVFCDQNDMIFKMPVEVSDPPISLNVDLAHYLCARLNGETSF